MKNKKLAIGIVAALIVFLLAILYVVFFDYYVDFKGLDSEKITVEYGDKFTQPKVTALGKGHVLNRKGTKLDLTCKGEVDDTKLGDYKLEYSATYRNKTTTKIITVSVVDTTEPKLTLVGDKEVSVEIGGTYSESGSSAEDIYDGDLTSKIEISGEVDSSKVQDCVITYKVTDSNGNVGKIKRKVHVVA